MYICQHEGVKRKSGEIMDKEYYLRFPSVLRNALLMEEVSFEEDTKITYAPFKVFRGITREPGESLDIQKTDFLSYAELKKKVRGKKAPGIGWYSCSCFIEKNELVEALKLPRYNKKIIEGIIKDEFGPQKTNYETKHVDLWLYENAAIEQGFKVIENG